MANYRKLGRVTSHRNLMLRNLVTDLLRCGRIETTVTRAKETRRMAEKMITLAKRGDLHARRQVLAYVMDETVVNNLFTDIAPKYAERNGGYTRIIKKGPRRGDAAEMAFIELVDYDENMAKTPKAAKKTRRSRRSKAEAENTSVVETTAEETVSAVETAETEEAPKAE